MNAQFPITTTPRYNFPLQVGNLQLPLHLIELSIQTLHKTHHQLEPTIPQQLSTIDDAALNTQLVRLKPNKQHITIFAIDVSSIRLGETSQGTLLAIRGAIVWKSKNSYQYVRLGPFPFHIPNHMKNDLHRLLNGSTYNAKAPTNLAPSTLYLQTRLTGILERWMQRSINEVTQNSIILWDGNMVAGTPDTPIKTMSKMLADARQQQNIILAFSKVTRLMLYNRKLTDLLLRQSPPCILMTQNYPQYENSIRNMGRINVAKLSKSSCTFRLDIDANLPQTEVIQAVQTLIGNDSIQNSYPETLRLAHIYSTFTAAEVLGLQRYISQESSLKMISRPNIRRILFGRFGKGPEG
ncbi:MAG: hypothetical protein JSV35_01910 [Candidatus Bathyarchaeota archaeon]|nr:MAG: hypothetical protein JSV35_01910 [Candidatus Bathyarchaeota archaeon]